MKRLILVVVIILIISSIFIYFFIPSIIVIKKSVPALTSERVVYDYFLTNKNKSAWWPNHQNSQSIDTNEFNLGGVKFNFKTSGFNSSEVASFDGNFNGIITSKLISNNKIELVWETYNIPTFEPFQRIKNYLEAKKLNQQIDIILNSFANFAKQSKNIYGFNIQKSTVKDTILITSTNIFNHSPNQKEISSLLIKLKNYTHINGAHATNYPMLNITQIIKSKYVTTLAIPIDSYITSNKTFKVKRMIPGNILFTEVKGGRNNINHALSQLKKYMVDFNYDSPAMPFESMITDRSLNQDTSKWITKIYYPIF